MVNHFNSVCMHPIKELSQEVLLVRQTESVHRDYDVFVSKESGCDSTMFIFSCISLVMTGSG
jgi:hypothetical protein